MKKVEFTSRLFLLFFSYSQPNLNVFSSQPTSNRESAIFAFVPSWRDNVKECREKKIRSEEKQVIPEKRRWKIGSISHPGHPNFYFSRLYHCSFIRKCMVRLAYWIHFEICSSAIHKQNNRIWDQHGSGLVFFTASTICYATWKKRL